jgi:hypothetical protein
MDPTFRLRTATRLHFLLLRRCGQHIDIGVLLKATARTHDGLWLCKSTGDAEMIRLARQLGQANRAHAEQESRLREDAMMNARLQATAAENATAKGGSAVQNMPWGRQTTGFGLTHPQALNTESHTRTDPPGRWFNPLHWMKGGARQGVA